jgi:hypothetical protein
MGCRTARLALITADSCRSRPGLAAMLRLRLADGARLLHGLGASVTCRWRGRLAPPLDQTGGRDVTGRPGQARRDCGTCRRLGRLGRRTCHRPRRAQFAPAMSCLTSGRTMRPRGGAAGTAPICGGRQGFPPGLRAFAGARPTADTGFDESRRIRIDCQDQRSGTPPAGDGQQCAARFRFAPSPSIPAAGSASPATPIQPPLPRRSGTQAGGVPEFWTK